MDDIMIHVETDEKHDRHMFQVLNKCCEIGLKLNPDKCEFGQDSLQFYGNMVSKHGLSTDLWESQHHNQNATTNHKDRTVTFPWNVQLPITLHTQTE